MTYEESVIQRMVKGNFSKPEELYGQLITELKRDKMEIKMHLNNNYKGDSIVDVGGGDGWLIEKMSFETKIVIDKRTFPIAFNHEIYFINEAYSPELLLNADVVVMSEFIHLFKECWLMQMLRDLKKQRLLIIEPKYDHFLDLRLRLWSKGRAYHEDDLDIILGVKHETFGKYNLWEISNEKQ